MGKISRPPIINSIVQSFGGARHKVIGWLRLQCWRRRLLRKLERRRRE